MSDTSKVYVLTEEEFKDAPKLTMVVIPTTKVTGQKVWLAKRDLAFDCRKQVDRDKVDFSPEAAIHRFLLKNGEKIAEADLELRRLKDLHQLAVRGAFDTREGED